MDRDAEPSTGTQQFWYRYPNAFRIETDGQMILLRNDEAVFVQDTDSILRMPPTTTIITNSVGDPLMLLGGERAARTFSSPHDYSQPTGPAASTLVGGRQGWQFTLAPPEHKPFPLEIVLDDATGTILRWSTAGGHNSLTLTDLDLTNGISDERFTYDGPVKEQTSAADHRDHLRELEDAGVFPSPKYWPRRPPVNLQEADEETGAFVGRLELGWEHPLLARWPSGTPAPQAVSSSGQHVHLWSDDDFEWGLVVDESLTADELAAVIASIS